MAPSAGVMYQTCYHNDVHSAYFTELLFLLRVTEAIPGRWRSPQLSDRLCKSLRRRCGRNYVKVLQIISNYESLFLLLFHSFYIT